MVVVAPAFMMSMQGVIPGGATLAVPSTTLPQWCKTRSCTPGAHLPALDRSVPQGRRHRKRHFLWPYNHFVAAAMVPGTGFDRLVWLGFGPPEDRRGGKGMRRNLIAIPLVILGLLLFTVNPSSLQAQERGNFTDFRGRSGYTEEDLAKSLFPEKPADMQTRGIGPAKPQTAPTPTTAGKTSIALNVFFESNSDKILPAFYADMDKLGKVLTDPQYSAYRVEIEGHTDSIGSDSYNQRLSQRRAESVKHYLTQRFPIASDRIAAKGFGESRPIASNDTLDGRGQNRRVEVVNPGTK
jgi:outer membrane protein OmpA-like peptidoglycan-associated protein